MLLVLAVMVGTQAFAGGGVIEQQKDARVNLTPDEKVNFYYKTILSSRIKTSQTKADLEASRYAKNMYRPERFALFAEFGIIDVSTINIDSFRANPVPYVEAFENNFVEIDGSNVKKFRTNYVGEKDGRPALIPGPVEGRDPYPGETFQAFPMPDGSFLIVDSDMCLNGASLVYLRAKLEDYTKNNSQPESNQTASISDNFVMPLDTPGTGKFAKYIGNGQPILIYIEGDKLDNSSTNKNCNCSGGGGSGQANTWSTPQIIASTPVQPTYTTSPGVQVVPQQQQSVMYVQQRDGWAKFKDGAVGVAALGLTAAALWGVYEVSQGKLQDNFTVNNWGTNSGGTGTWDFKPQQYGSYSTNTILNPNTWGGNGYGTYGGSIINTNSWTTGGGSGYNTW